MSTITLNYGSKMPLLAFGTGTAHLKRSQSDDLERVTVDAVKTAIRAGYRHLDTAEMYNTEPEVGAAIKESISEGIVTRDDLFVTTKISDNFLQVESAIDVSLQKLGLDYVDSYLMHSPYWTTSHADLQAAWAGMEAVHASGKARSIGVSNFDEPHLQALLATARVLPSINQIEFHPYFPHVELQQFSRDHGNIALSAYGALHPVTRNVPGPLDATLDSLAKKYQVSPGLVCMRWCIDQNVVVVTTSRKEERMRDYLRVFDFTLTQQEVQEIAEKGALSLKEHKEEVVPRVIKYYRSIGIKV